MNVLIVYAHPSNQSYNASLLNEATETLRIEGHNVQISDLYEMNFKAVADQHDFKSLKNPDRFSYISEQVNASKNSLFSEDIKLEQDKVMWADTIIFQYPMWWSEPPAILKGWFDRVFAAGFAYIPGVYNHGGLKGKKAMLAFTIGGNDLSNYGVKGLKGEMNERLFNIQHEILYFAGMDVLEPFIIPVGVGEEGRKEYIELYKERLQNLNNIPMISFHPIEDYENGQLKENKEVRV